MPDNQSFRAKDTPEEFVEDLENFVSKNMNRMAAEDLFAANLSRMHTDPHFITMLMTRLNDIALGAIVGYMQDGNKETYKEVEIIR